MNNQVYILNENELMHHGVLGMKWGIRRYQSYSEAPRGSGKRGKEIGEAKQYTKEGARKATITGGLIGRAIYKKTHTGKDESTKQTKKKTENKKTSEAKSPLKKDGSMKINNSDSGITRQVKRDYNTLSELEFTRKYAISKKKYLKRVEKYGDPFKKMGRSSNEAKLDLEKIKKANKTADARLKYDLNSKAINSIHKNTNSMPVKIAATVAQGVNAYKRNKAVETATKDTRAEIRKLREQVKKERKTGSRIPDKVLRDGRGDGTMTVNNSIRDKAINLAVKNVQNKSDKKQAKEYNKAFNKYENELYIKYGNKLERAKTDDEYFKIVDMIQDEASSKAANDFKKSNGKLPSTKYVPSRNRTKGWN